MKLSTKIFTQLVIVFFIGITTCYAQVPPPKFLQFQGKLTDTLGIGINDTLTMEFSLHDDSTGGILLWQETIPNVVVYKGLFAVNLGATNPITLPFDRQYWLEIKVDGNTLSPRVKLSAVAYAYRAYYTDSAAYAYASRVADSSLFAHTSTIAETARYVIGGTAVSDSDWAVSGNNIYTGTADYFPSRNVGIGTATPTNKLSVAAPADTAISAEGSVGIFARSTNANYSGYFESGPVRIYGDTVFPSGIWADGTMFWNTRTESLFVYDTENGWVLVGPIDTGTASMAPGHPSYIWNQDTIQQNANMWISGKVKAETLDVANIKGQGYTAVSFSGSPISIDSSEFVPLFSASYNSESSAGSGILVTFTGTFDDRAGKTGSAIEIQLVRDPGASEQVLTSQKETLWDRDTHKDRTITLSAMDFPPQGLHTYAVRARVFARQFASGRFIQGNLQIVEVKQ